LPAYDFEVSLRENWLLMARRDPDAALGAMV
jgi:hypothetical protein